MTINIYMHFLQVVLYTVIKLPEFNLTFCPYKLHYIFHGPLSTNHVFSSLMYSHYIILYEQYKSLMYQIKILDKKHTCKLFSVKIKRYKRFFFYILSKGSINRSIKKKKLKKKKKIVKDFSDYYFICQALQG